MVASEAAVRWRRKDLRGAREFIVVDDIRVALFAGALMTAERKQAGIEYLYRTSITNA
jgi:hypothetical protein